MIRLDPFHSFRFSVEIAGLIVGGFSKVKGLVRETKFESFREGGLNDYEHKLASQTTYSNLVLERGLLLPEIWKWHDDVVAGRITRRKITIGLKNEFGIELWRWHLDAAYPVKWSVADLDASSSAVAVESIEFVHHGLRLGL